MVPDKVDAGWTKKAGEDGEEEPEERRKRKSKKKENVGANNSSDVDKLTERDIYMINKGMEMEIKMRGRAAGIGGGGGEGYRDLFTPPYPDYLLPDSLLYQHQQRSELFPRRPPGYYQSPGQTMFYQHSARSLYPPPPPQEYPQPLQVFLTSFLP